MAVSDKSLKIIFSATRQWNPGDQFIVRGAIRAFTLAGFDVTPVLFNRNPQIRPAPKGPIRRVLHALARHLSGFVFMDNSVKDSTDIDFADVVVFAGSPQWRGRRLKTLYRKIIAADKPAIFLGIGTNRSFSFGRADFSAAEMAVMRKSRLITCRDPLTAQALSALPVHALACPAFLSAERESIRHRVRRVGLIFGSDEAVANNRISRTTFSFLRALYTQLVERHGETIDFEFVAHYIDELPHFHRDPIAARPLRYSYDARDYADIYARYDLVVGHRVHGIGIAASLGIPGICVVHDLRGETARAFGATLVSTETPIVEVLERFREACETLEARSRALIASKRAVEARYVELLREAFEGDSCA